MVARQERQQSRDMQAVAASDRVAFVQSERLRVLHPCHPVDAKTERKTNMYFSRSLFSLYSPDKIPFLHSIGLICMSSDRATPKKEWCYASSLSIALRSSSNSNGFEKPMMWRSSSSLVGRLVLYMIVGVSARSSMLCSRSESSNPFISGRK